MNDCIRVCSPVESLTLPVFFLFVAPLQALKGLNVLDGFKCFVKVIHNVSDERFDVLLKNKKVRHVGM